MKIIIVGAGVAGLSSYLQFRRLLPAFHSHDIIIYECHRPGSLTLHGDSNPALSAQQDILTDTAAVVGNNIGLPPQTVRLLKYINPKLYELFRARSYANETYMYRTARGHTLAVFPTADKGNPPEHTVTCPRQTLWQCLLDVVGEDKITYRRVVGVDLDGVKPAVRFADGGEEEADLVIGADGARSVVGAAIFGGHNNDGVRYRPEYEGLCGVGGFINTELPATMTRHKSMTFTMGLAGSFGYCSVAPESQNTLGWWFNWQTSSLPENNIMDPEQIQQHLQDHVGTWKDPIIQQIISDMSTNRVYPIWTTPELPFWGMSGVVLLGDSAHTVQATSGLGASLSLESSVVFSLLLAHYLNKPSQSLTTGEAVELATKGLYEIQNPKAANIRAQARRRSIMKTQFRGVLFEYLFYLYVYLWTNFALFSSMVLGTVEARAPGETLEAEVKEYLRTHDS